MNKKFSTKVLVTTLIIISVVFLAKPSTIDAADNSFTNPAWIGDAYIHYVDNGYQEYRYSIMISDRIRGAEALSLVQQHNRYNDIGQNEELFLLYVTIELDYLYVNGEAADFWTSDYDFTVYNNGGEYRSDNYIIYNNELSGSIKPGGRLEGWVPIVTRKGGSNIIEYDYNPVDGLDGIFYDLNQPEHRLTIATYRAGNSGSYYVGDTVNLAVRAENGNTHRPYVYAFIINGVNVQQSGKNIYAWKPSEPGVYTIEYIAYDGDRIAVEELDVEIKARAPLNVATFRTGWSNSYELGQTIDLAARGENGVGPYKYQFYAIRSNGSRVNFRSDPVSSNIYPWTPTTPDTYTIGVEIYDSTGAMVREEKTINIANPKPLDVATFRTGWSNSYELGQTIDLAARGENGSGQYKYLFYAIRSNGSRVNFRSGPVGSNIYPWTPTTPDTYTIGVEIYDSTGSMVREEKTINIANPKPLEVAIFRAGWSESYSSGQLINLAARGDGGIPGYKYQFFVIRSNGSRVNFRQTPLNSNVYPWTPINPDNYILGVDVYDSTGTKVTITKPITVVK